MLLDSILSLIAPHECLVCTAEGALLCENCCAGLSPAIARCYKCHSAGSFVTCSDCRPDTPLSAVYAAAAYQGAAKDIVWRLKFGRTKAAANEMARIMSAALQLKKRLPASSQQLRDCIITHVPTAPSRVRQRGYDQAALLARALAAENGLSYRSLLVRSGRQKQVGAGRTIRSTQLITAFRPPNPAAIAGLRIILVDDVITTGATLEAAARALLNAGACRVDAIVFAQA